MASKGIKNDSPRLCPFGDKCNEEWDIARGERCTFELEGDLSDCPFLDREDGEITGFNLGLGTGVIEEEDDEALNEDYEAIAQDELGLSDDDLPF